MPEYKETEPTAIELSGTQTVMPCPKCGGTMYGSRYEARLKILSERTWNTCIECGYEIDMSKWKRSLLTV